MNMGLETIFKALRGGKSVFQESGDIGLVAEQVYKERIGAETRELSEVYEGFQRISQVSGVNSGEAKEAMVRELLEAGASSRRYVARWLAGNLKTGAGEKTVMAGLARAIAIEQGAKEDSEERGAKLEEEMAERYAVVPDYKLLIESLTTEVLLGQPLSLQSQVGVPVQSMLSKSIKGYKEVESRFSGLPFACEYKYDGMRG